MCNILGFSYFHSLFLCLIIYFVQLVPLKDKDKIERASFRLAEKRTPVSTCKTCNDHIAASDSKISSVLVTAMKRANLDNELIRQHSQDDPHDNEGDRNTSQYSSRKSSKVLTNSISAMSMKMIADISSVNLSTVAVAVAGADKDGVECQDHVVQPIYPLSVQAYVEVIVLGMRDL